jgi:hypothetical protein
MEKVNCSNCGADNSTKARYCSNCGYELPKITNDFISSDVQQERLLKPRNNKNYIGIVVGVAFFAIAYFGTQKLFFNSGSIDKEMMNVANEINKSCPMMIDSETRLDNTVAMPDKVFQYNYTLVNLDKSQVDTVSAKKYLETNIVNQVKTNPQMKYQRDHQWILNYLYKDKNGIYLLMINVTPDKYAE